MKVLLLDQSGYPKRWASVEKAMFYHAKGLVAWSVGEDIATFHGGDRRVDGVRSTISTPSIIAIKNRSFKKVPHSARVVLTNQSLFARDRCMCTYCLQVFPTNQLSRDHIQPVFLGGEDKWTNVVTACLNCNGAKGHKTLKQLGWKLGYVPYEPNYYESLILKNRNILACQMAFLLANVPKQSRLKIS